MLPEQTHAVFCGLRRLTSFCENERALQYGLRVERELKCVLVLNFEFLNCLLEVGFEHRGMIPNVRFASVSKFGIRLVNLLENCSEKAAVFVSFTLKELFSHVDVAKNFVERIGEVVKFCLSEERIGKRREVVGRLNGEILFG